VTAGIIRIQIDSNWQDRRTKLAIDCTPTADELYRDIFADQGMILLPETEIVHCTKQEAMSRYDWKEGIDVLLHFEHLGKATLQEKYLTYHESTITFEERKNSGRLGAWYTCTAQYYFVGYARKWESTGCIDFQDWILIDLAHFKRLDAQRQIPWGTIRRNKSEGRRNPFRWVYFHNVPRACVVADASTWIPVEQLAFL
jgi:hypothetical protein